MLKANIIFWARQQIDVKKIVFFYILIFLFGIIGCQRQATDDGIENIQIDFPKPKANSKRHFIINNPEKLKGEEILGYDFSKIPASKIDSVLKVLLVLDQEYRIKWAKLRELRSDANTLFPFGKKMKRADSLNYIIISKIIDEIGWPNRNIYSDSAMAAPFYIILHTNGNRLEKFNVHLEEAFKNGEIKSEYYAILIDKILLSTGRDQKYGTHCKFNRDGPAIRYSTGEIEAIEENRSKIGLDSLPYNGCELMKY